MQGTCLPIHYYVEKEKTHSKILNHSSHVKLGLRAATLPLNKVPNIPSTNLAEDLATIVAIVYLAIESKVFSCLL